MENTPPTGYVFLGEKLNLRSQTSKIIAGKDEYTKWPFDYTEEKERSLPTYLLWDLCFTFQCISPCFSPATYSHSFHMNVGSYNHMKTFTSDECFGLVCILQRGDTGKYTQPKKWKTSSTIFTVIYKNFFVPSGLSVTSFITKAIIICTVQLICSFKASPINPQLTGNMLPMETSDLRQCLLTFPSKAKRQGQGNSGNLWHVYLWMHKLHY